MTSASNRSFPMSSAMFRIFRKLFFVILVISIARFHAVDGNRDFAGAEEADLADGEEDGDEGHVETEEADIGYNIPSDAVVASDGEDDDEDDDDGEKPLKASADADTYILFTKPSGTLDLPAGEIVEFLVGFTNKGPKDFVLDALDASFRYPMDFNFYIQNFSTIHYTRVVKPKTQVTLSYSFIPNEAFSARPFGLTVNLLYKDSEGAIFSDAVFNQTVNIVELEDGLDGETFFLYVFLAACIVLLLVAGQQFLSSFGRKRPSKKQVVEMGTSNPNDVDYDWLPKETLSELNKSPRRSPRQRRTKRGTGLDD